MVNSGLDAFRSSYHLTKKIPICCPICGRHALLPFSHGDRHDLGLNIVMCEWCGMGMISPRPEAVWFDQFYRNDFWPVYIGSRFKDLDDMYIQDQCAERSKQIFEAINPKLSPPKKLSGYRMRPGSHACRVS